MYPRIVTRLLRLIRIEWLYQTETYSPNLYMYFVVISQGYAFLNSHLAALQWRFGNQIKIIVLTVVVKGTNWKIYSHSYDLLDIRTKEEIVTLQWNPTYANNSPDWSLNWELGGLITFNDIPNVWSSYALNETKYRLQLLWFKQMSHNHFMLHPVSK